MSLPVIIAAMPSATILLQNRGKLADQGQAVVVPVFEDKVSLYVITATAEPLLHVSSYISAPEHEVFLHLKHESLVGW